MYHDAIRPLGWLGILTIGVLSLVPGDLRPHAAAGLITGQLEHVAAYFLTAAVLTLGYAAPTHSRRIITLLTLYAGLLEIAQLWIPGRTSQFIDFAASSVGACIGAYAVIGFGKMGWLTRGARSERSHGRLP